MSRCSGARFSFCLIGVLIDEDSVIGFAKSKGQYRLFASMTVTMAGVDLLAKFWAESDPVGKVGEGITGFAERYVFRSHKDPRRSSEILYPAIRKPMLHSFTPYDQRYEVLAVQHATRVSTSLRMRKSRATCDLGRGHLARVHPRAQGVSGGTG